MSTLEVIAIISPAPGKVDRVQELLTELAEYVQANEPGTYKYHLHKEIDKETPEFVMVETYKDQKSFDVHRGSDAFASLGKRFQEEELLARDLSVLVLKPVAGFAGRS